METGLLLEFNLQNAEDSSFGGNGSFGGELYEITFPLSTLPPPNLTFTRQGLQISMNFPSQNFQISLQLYYVLNPYYILSFFFFLFMFCHLLTYGKMGQRSRKFQKQLKGLEGIANLGAILQTIKSKISSIHQAEQVMHRL